LRARDRATVRDPIAFAVTAGVRAAIKIDRDRRALPYDPLDAPPLDQEAEQETPVDRLEIRAQLARVAEALEQLDEEKLAAFQLRFIERVPHSEACARLGIARSAYFDRVKAAKTAVEDAVALSSHSFRRRQRQLLSDYVCGLLHGRMRKRAERLIAADPQALVMARELQRAHRDAALLLPAVGLHSISARTLDVAATPWPRISETLGDWAGRASAEGASNAAAAGGARAAGAASAGLLAKVFGGLGASGVALGCLGGGAVATVVCVVTGVIPLPGHGDEAKEDRPALVRDSASASHRAKPQLLERDPAMQEESGIHSTSRGPAREDLKESHSGRGSRSTPTLEASTPAGVEEFGVAGAGTPVGGAPPDTNESDGASASSVRQEFGP
jgi:hypothetical protein